MSVAVIGAAYWADPQSQVKLGMFVVGIAVVLQIAIKPFENSATNHFHTFSVVVTYLTFYIGAFSLDAQDNKVASSLALTVNIGYLLVAAVVIIKAILLMKKQKKAKKAKSCKVVPVDDDTVSGVGKDQTERPAKQAEKVSERNYCEVTSINDSNITMPES